MYIYLFETPCIWQSFVTFYFIHLKKVNVTYKFYGYGFFFYFSMNIYVLLYIIVAWLKKQYTLLKLIIKSYPNVTGSFQIVTINNFLVKLTQNPLTAIRWNKKDTKRKESFQKLMRRIGVSFTNKSHLQ